MTMRLMPHESGNFASIKVNGRTYTCAAGAMIDVPDHDGVVMVANGWTIAAESVSATTTRPSNPYKGQTLFDTTLGYVIKYDGKTWRNPASGASV